MTASKVATLDFGWWANNGPTAGYLVRLALDAAEDLDHQPDQVARHAVVQLLGLPAASSFEYEATRLPRQRPRTGLTFVTFRQQRLFATAQVLTGSAHGPSSPGDVTPPPALPREAYVPIVMYPAQVPVTRHFEYRPTGRPDGCGPREGWDAVWLTPAGRGLRGRKLVASMIDSWYPPGHMRAVRQHLRGGRPLDQPKSTILISVTVAFTAADPAYDDVCHALLASQVTGTAGGWSLERHEIWSEQGDLLATADMVREILQDAA